MSGSGRDDHDRFRPVADTYLEWKELAMPFTETKWFPFTVGFIVLAAAIGLGAAGWISPKFSACVAMFGMGFVLDGSAGVHALPLLAIRHPQEQKTLTERILYSRKSSAPRYTFAIALGVVYLLVNLFTTSDVVTLVALVACTTIYGFVSGVSLFRAFGEAGAQIGAKVR